MKAARGPLLLDRPVTTTEVVAVPGEVRRTVPWGCSRLYWMRLKHLRAHVDRTGELGGGNDG